jgi:hypothetical protein
MFLSFSNMTACHYGSRRDNKPHPILHRKSAQSQQYPCCHPMASSPQKVPCLCLQIALEKKLLVDPLVAVLDLCMLRMPQSESLQAVPTPCLITRPHWLYEQLAQLACLQGKSQATEDHCPQGQALESQ